jgi:thiamine-phosphate pyrophosphorylase
VLELVRAGIDAGVDLVQVREPALPARDLAELVARAVEWKRGATTKIVVNDRFDVALAAGADGVHLGGRSLPAAHVRATAPRGFLVGCSVHGPDEARALGEAGTAE